MLDHHLTSCDRRASLTSPTTVKVHRRHSTGHPRPTRRLIHIRSSRKDPTDNSTTRSQAPTTPRPVQAIRLTVSLSWTLTHSFVIVIPAWSTDMMLCRSVSHDSRQQHATQVAIPAHELGYRLLSYPLIEFSSICAVAIGPRCAF